MPRGVTVERLLEILNRDHYKEYADKVFCIELPNGDEVSLEAIEAGKDKIMLLYTPLSDTSKKSKREIRRYDPFDVFIEMVKAHAFGFDKLFGNSERAIADAYMMDRLPFYAEIDAVDSSDSRTEHISAMACNFALWAMRDGSEYDKTPEWAKFEEGH